MPNDRPNIAGVMFLRPDEALRVWEERTPLRPTVNWSEMMHEAHASAFTVAKIAKLDLLSAVRESLDDVIRNGGTFEEWKANLLPELQRHGWWGAVNDLALTGSTETVVVNDRRLRTIYRTNLRMSIAGGRWRKYQAEKPQFPYIRYLSDHYRKQPREDHKSWHGLILPVDHPAWQWMFPPNGWGCKCRTEQVSEARMRRNGWTVGVAPNPPQTAFITAAGDTIMVPEGVDPGFGYNPGTAHLRVLADRAIASLARSLDSGLDDVAGTALRQIIADPAFDQFLALPASRFPIAILAPDAPPLIGSSSRIVVLPTNIVRKQKGEMPGVSVGHAELSIDDYRALPDIIDRALVIAKQGDSRLIYFSDASGRIWKAVVRQDGGQPYPAIVSFHRSQARKIDPETHNLDILVDRR